MKTYSTGLSDKEKIEFLSSFSIMLTAGISILEIVDSLLEDAKGNQKKILISIREDLSQGHRLNLCFSKFPNAFDKVMVNIIKASEEAGTLEQTLKDLRDTLTQDIEFKDTVKSALTYPILILVVFMGVLLMLLIFIIPKIASVFLRLRVTLPLPTKILIFTSDIILTHTIPLITTVAIAMMILIFLYKTQKKKFLNVLFSLPLISEMIKLIDLTRFTHSMSLLLHAGLPITYALDLTKEIVLKREVFRIIMHCADTVLAGKKLSEGMKDHKGIIPSIMIKITEAGEKSGSLEKSMQDISIYLDYQVKKTLKTVTTLLEPLMLVVVGVLIGGMMLSIIAPIYGLIGQVGGR